MKLSRTQVPLPASYSDCRCDSGSAQEAAVKQAVMGAAAVAAAAQSWAAAVSSDGAELRCSSGSSPAARHSLPVPDALRACTTQRPCVPAWPGCRPLVDAVWRNNRECGADAKRL